MNDLTTNIAPTMTSREIAELVEARHNDVIATIDRLFAKDLLRSSRKSRQEATGGRPIMVYDLIQRDCYLVVAGYSDEMRARVIDRWQELEAQIAKPEATALPDFTNPAVAARAWADQFEQRLSLEAKVQADAPKVAFVDKYATAEGNKGVREVVKLLDANEREFVAFLVGTEIMYRLNDHLTAYAHHQHAGRFVVKTGIGRNERAFTQSLFTPKGIQWIAQKWAEYQSAHSSVEAA
jgi:phage antirepressor YoqD-like protein